MQKFWKIIFLKNSKRFHHALFEFFKNFEFFRIFKFFKISKKGDDGPIADLKCNHWRRDSITNITSDVVAFCQLSSVQSSTSFEIFKNFETFKNLKTWKNLKNLIFLKDLKKLMNSIIWLQPCLMLIWFQLWNFDLKKLINSII